MRIAPRSSIWSIPRASICRIRTHFPGQYGAGRIFYYNSLMRRKLRVPQIAAVMARASPAARIFPRSATSSSWWKALASWALATQPG